MSAVDTLLRFEHVGREFAAAAAAVPVLDDVSFSVARGEVVALLGRSGSGKSTLIHLAAGIDVPTRGRIHFDGADLTALHDAQRTRLRRDAIGLVFQFFHLLPHLSVLENVVLPASIAGAPSAPAVAAARKLLDRVGLLAREHAPAGVLSGGEQQRVALCRALVRGPRLVLADEPTGNLDDRNAAIVMDLLFELVQDSGAALLFVTHDRDLAARADRVLTLHSGRLEAPCSASS
ncbi:MAG: ABC transporter ATP-binding protein [Planctomycetes bacterium]|nr:ABC transporter ATP-binding protein [Planctomycetota bacterium]MCC7171577.1 ABC transporter ATP-binding protein [Planctomycetota bacterium]